MVQFLACQGAALSYGAVFNMTWAALPHGAVFNMAWGRPPSRATHAQLHSHWVHTPTLVRLVFRGRAQEMDLQIRLFYS